MKRCTQIRISKGIFVHVKAYLVDINVVQNVGTNVPLNPLDEVMKSETVLLCSLGCITFKTRIQIDTQHEITLIM